jgi:hypothetical protein
MDPAPLEQSLALASAMLLMVLGGLGKGRLEWQPRRPFRLRRRRRPR